MCIDIQYEWDGFASCRRPIHKWLLLSYSLVVMSRLVHVAGALMFLGATVVGSCWCLRGSKSPGILVYLEEVGR